MTEAEVKKVEGSRVREAEKDTFLLLALVGEGDERGIETGTVSVWSVP